MGSEGLGSGELGSEELGSRIVTPTPSHPTPPFSKLPTPTPLHTFRVKSSLNQVARVKFGHVKLSCTHFGMGQSGGNRINKQFSVEPNRSMLSRHY